MFPAGRRFGRNSGPPGNFREFFDPPEPRSCSATFVHFALTTVWPPAVAIRDLLDLGGSGGLREISRPPRARNGPKPPKKWIFPVLGAVLGQTPADQI